MSSVRRKAYTDDQIIKALDETHGMAFLAAERIGCSHVTILRRSLSTPAVRSTIEKWRGRLVDVAELKLEKAIDSGEPWAIALTLKTRGKDRGYVERQEVTGENGADIRVKVSVDDLTDDELARIARRGGLGVTETPSSAPEPD